MSPWRVWFWTLDAEEFAELTPLGSRRQPTFVLDVGS